MRLRVKCTLSCNLQSWARTHAILVIGLYELLGNPNYLTHWATRALVLYVSCISYNISKSYHIFWTWKIPIYWYYWLFIEYLIILVILKYGCFEFRASPVPIFHVILWWNVLVRSASLLQMLLKSLFSNKDINIFKCL